MPGLCGRIGWHPYELLYYQLIRFMNYSNKYSRVDLFSIGFRTYPSRLATQKLRHYDVKTTSRRRFNVMTTLLLRRVPVGYTVSSRHSLSANRNIHSCCLVDHDFNRARARATVCVCVQSLVHNLQFPRHLLIQR